MSKNKEEQIIEEYINYSRRGEDNLLRASIGLLNAKSTKQLSEVVSGLHHQIPITISELRNTISQQTNKTIESNKKISESNSRNVRALNILTFVLALATIALVVVSSMQYLTIKKSNENQLLRWKIEDFRNAIDNNL